MRDDGLVSDERPDLDGRADDAPRGRTHRRAVGGTVPVGTGHGGVPGPDALGRSRDDTDEGWGERATPDDDERLRREVPPHW